MIKELIGWVKSIFGFKYSIGVGQKVDPQPVALTSEQIILANLQRLKSILDQDRDLTSEDARKALVSTKTIREELRKDLLNS